MCGSQVYELVHFFQRFSIHKYIGGWPWLDILRILLLSMLISMQLFSPPFQRVVAVLHCLPEARYCQQTGSCKVVVLQWTLIAVKINFFCIVLWGGIHILWLSGDFCTIDVKIPHQCGNNIADWPCAYLFTWCGLFLITLESLHILSKICHVIQFSTSACHCLVSAQFHVILFQFIPQTLLQFLPPNKEDFNKS